MTRYFNSNKLQVLLQNPKRADARYSDAPLHSHSYSFAMGLPFVPVFFQSAQYLDPEGRKELKNLISIYRQNREKMFDCYTFPIGETPSNASWSGFQMTDNSLKEGFILLFREIHNTEPEKSLQLKFLAGKTLTIKNLMTGNTEKKTADKNGTFSFSIEQPADFLFLQYKVAE